jgi:SPOR domain
MPGLSGHTDMPSQMLAKFALVLLIAIFGATLFALGVLAPERMRQPVIAAAKRVQTLGVPHKPTAAPSTPTAKPKTPSAVSYEALLVPTPLPPGTNYALQLGLYPDQAVADAWNARAQHSGTAISQIPVLDQNGTRWIAVAAGRYDSPEEARAARLSIARELNLTQPLPIIRLPPEPPADAAPTAAQQTTPTLAATTSAAPVAP